MVKDDFVGLVDEDFLIVEYEVGMVCDGEGVEEGLHCGPVHMCFG